MIEIKYLRPELLEAIARNTLKKYDEGLVSGYEAKEVPIEEIIESEQIESMLLPMDAPLGHLPRVDILPAARRMVENGNAIPRRLCGAVDETAGPLRAYLESEFVGIAHWEEETLRFDAMLWERTEP